MLRTAKALAIVTSNVGMFPQNAAPPHVTLKHRDGPIYLYEHETGQLFEPLHSAQQPPDSPEKLLQLQLEEPMGGKHDFLLW